MFCCSGEPKAKKSVQWCIEKLGLVLGDDPIPLTQWEKLHRDQQPHDKGPSRCVFVEVNDGDSVEPDQRGYYWIPWKEPEEVDDLLSDTQSSDLGCQKTFERSNEKVIYCVDSERSVQP
jgi:hypothetical protein